MNDAPVNPHDVIIRQRRAGGFSLATSNTPAQIVCRTFEEALVSAGDFVDRHAGLVWYVDDREAPVRIDRRLLARVWAEYCELPGLGLTAAQAQRLWGVDARTCATLLDVLVRTKLLTHGADGRYRRLTADAVGSGARMAKAASRSSLAAAGAERVRHG